MFEQSDEDIVRGVLRLTVGDKEHQLRVLKMDKSAEWRALFAEKVGKGLDDLDPTSNERVIARITALASSMTLELITAYDREAALGTVNHLESVLTQRQALEILKAIVRVEFPLAEIGPLLVETIQPGLMRAIDRWISVRSTSSLSESGASSLTDPTPSSPASPEDSSNSSGARLRSVRSGKQRSTKAA